jgi:hypothetical protein
MSAIHGTSQTTAAVYTTTSEATLASLAALGEKI